MSLPSPRRIRGAFTLVELLVSMAVLTLLTLVLFAMLNQTASLWRYTSSKTEQFREARDGFEAMTRRIAQATLNTYWDYHYPNDDKTKPPDNYIRQSELRFISGQAEGANGVISTAVSTHSTHCTFFQAPLGFVMTGSSATANYQGLENLLNTWGYFVEFGSDQNLRPTPLPATLPLRWRFRLMELMQPAEQLTLYKYTNGVPGYTGHEWFLDALGQTPRPVHVLAENVVALVILPKLTPLDEAALANKPVVAGTALAPNYFYDSTSVGSSASAANANDKGMLNSKNQMPPVVQVTMVTIDETSAARLATGADPGNTGIMPDLGLSGFFQVSANYQQDLLYDPANSPSQDSLEKRLVAKKLNYRIFTSEVSIKGAKWSRVQTN